MDSKIIRGKLEYLRGRVPPRLQSQLDHMVKMADQSLVSIEEVGDTAYTLLNELELGYLWEPQLLN